MRTGRPRKANADRHPCGKVKRATAQQIADAQRAAEEAEMRVVLAQPHRRGNRSQLAESPLGRFCLANALPREYFDAGEAYACVKRQWQAAWGTPLVDRLGGSGRDIDWAQVRKWDEMLRAWEGAMLDAGGYHGRLSVVSLAMNAPMQCRIYPEEAKIALEALAKFQGRLGKPS